jgi:5,6-dimethylbenzimidazole synthase
MQPWRFIRVTDRALREQMHALVETERQATAQALGERQDDFMRLKVEGLLDAGEVVVVALADEREKHIFGRRTLPEMDLASVACAIQNMWLAARAEGIGLGWVSIFDPSSSPACWACRPAPARWRSCASATWRPSTRGPCSRWNSGPSACPSTA